MCARVAAACDAGARGPAPVPAALDPAAAGRLAAVRRRRPVHASGQEPDLAARADESGHADAADEHRPATPRDDQLGLHDGRLQRRAERDEPGDLAALLGRRARRQHDLGGPGAPDDGAAAAGRNGLIVGSVPAEHLGPDRGDGGAVARRDGALRAPGRHPADPELGAQRDDLRRGPVPGRDARGRRGQRDPGEGPDGPDQALRDVRRPDPAGRHRHPGPGRASAVSAALRVRHVRQRRAPASRPGRVDDVLIPAVRDSPGPRRVRIGAERARAGRGRARVRQPDQEHRRPQRLAVARILRERLRPRDGLDGPGDRERHRSGDADLDLVRAAAGDRRTGRRGPAEDVQ